MSGSGYLELRLSGSNYDLFLLSSIFLAWAGFNLQIYPTWLAGPLHLIINFFLTKRSLAINSLDLNWKSDLTNLKLITLNH